MKNISVVLIYLLSMMLTGCASLTDLPKGAKKIIITEKPVSKHCKWLKQITFTNPGHPPLTLYKHALLEKEEFNQLRIQAYAVGGNKVFLSQYQRIKKVGNKTQEKHYMVGEVYYCKVE